MFAHQRLDDAEKRVFVPLLDEDRLLSLIVDLALEI